MDLSAKLQMLLMGIIPIILAITLHEAAHAFVAKKLGDNTAFALGRVSLNPLVHIDWIGTVLLPAVLFMTTGFIFGWAKPVPVVFSNLKNPRRDSILVSAAGPGANLLMAIMWAILYHLTKGTGIDYVDSIQKIATFGVLMNIYFMLFNLIPILPLDGGRILQGFLPLKASLEFSKIEPYGIWIVLALAYLQLLAPIIMPIAGIFNSILL